MRHMPHDLPAWVAELTDPRRARTLDELADRLVPLAEHAIDVSRRLQALLAELNEPFGGQALRERTDRLKERADEALGEVVEEIAASGRERVARIHAACQERAAAGAGPDGGPTRQQVADRAAELRERLDAKAGPLILRQQRKAAGRVRAAAAAALQESVRWLLDRAGELAEAVTDLVGQALPKAREGLELAGRISALSARARSGGHGPVPPDLAAEAAELADACEQTIGRLEREWSVLGARGATVRAALRSAEEAAFSQVTAALTRCVEELALDHARALGEAEAQAMTLLEELSADPAGT